MSAKIQSQIGSRIEQSFLSTGYKRIQLSVENVRDILTVGSVDSRVPSVELAVYVCPRGEAVLLAYEPDIGIPEIRTFSSMLKLQDTFNTELDQSAITVQRMFTPAVDSWHEVQCKIAFSLNEFAYYIRDELEGLEVGEFCEMTFQEGSLPIGDLVTLEQKVAMLDWVASRAKGLFFAEAVNAAGSYAVVGVRLKHTVVCAGDTVTMTFILSNKHPTRA